MKKMNKKVTAYGLSAIVVLSIIAVVMPVSAQIPMADDFGVNDASGDAGTYVMVPVNITNVSNGPIATIIFDISYTDSVLSVVGAQKGDLISQWPICSCYNIEAGHTRCSAAYDAMDPHPIQNASTGTVVLLNFSVIGMPGASSMMNLTRIQFSNTRYEMGTAPAKDGTFYVTEAPAATTGDININEIMYNPQGTDTHHEWVELYNNDTKAINITGWKFHEAGTNHGLALEQGSMTIPDGGYAIIADNATMFLVEHSECACTVIDSVFSLSQTGEYIALKNATLDIIDDVTYEPIATENYTLELNATGGWEESLVEGGTPCQPNSVVTPPAPTTTPTLTPEPNAAGWNKETVMLSFLRSDYSGTGINYTNLSATPSVTVNISNVTAGVYANNTELNAAGYLVDSSFGKTFDVTISNECDTTISYYTVDNASNTEVAKDVTVRIDKTPSGTVTGLGGTDVGCTWINWTWTNPSDADFSYVMVYSGLGEHVANVYGAPGEMSYINTSDYCTFDPDTPYEIGTRTVDIAGNVNLTWVNDTATTSEDEEPPVITDLHADPYTSVSRNNPTTISATVTDNVGLSEVYLFVISGNDMILRLHNITDTNVNNVYNGTWDATQLGLTNGTITEMPVTTIKEYEEYAVLGSYQKNQTVPEEDAVAVFYSDYHLKGIYTMENDELLEIEPGNSTFMVYNINVSEEELVNGTTFMIDDRAEFKLVPEAVSDGTYAVGIHAMDFAENENAGETDVSVDNTPPNIVVVPSASSITTNSATITWTTNEASNSVVEYGTTTAYGDNKPEAEMVTDHTIDLTGLSAGTTYHYRVKSTDAANNPVVSGDYTFTTESVRRGGGGGGAPRGDSDGDGISDIDEMLAGTDKDDPCDPDPECAACKALAPTPTPTPTAAPTAEPTAKPTTLPAPTPKPTAEPTATPEEPGFEAVFGIAGLLAVAYLVVRRKRK